MAGETVLSETGFPDESWLVALVGRRRGEGKGTFHCLLSQRVAEEWRYSKEEVSRSFPDLPNEDRPGV